MHTYKELVEIFKVHFAVSHFPKHPATLYEPGEYFLQTGGKRIRPVICLMGNELFDDINPDTYPVATAVELFHNFTLIHDDIMDAALLRRGIETVHRKYGTSTALLCGDVMMIKAYEYINKIKPVYINRILSLFNKTAREVCEGQQIDMDFEKLESVVMSDYIHMITLKTSVLLAASLEMGAILGGAGESNCRHIYEFGKHLGIAFQIQDDYLDAFGDPKKFGKATGGDIRQNKKTFLLLYALEVASASQKEELKRLLAAEEEDKVAKVLQIFEDCKVGEWVKQLKQTYLETALQHLEDIAVISTRKKPLIELAELLIKREF